MHISFSVGFTYEMLNRIIFDLLSEQYESKWATANINLATLINPRESYGFYVSEETDLTLVVEDVVNNIVRCSFSYFESCDSPSKYYELLRKKCEIVMLSTYALKRPEWNLLALSVLLNDGSCETVLEEYNDYFEKNGFSTTALREKVISILNERG